MAEQTPDQAKQLLLNRLIRARTEASLLETAITASLISMAILSISPTWTDDRPVALNDNQSYPEKR